MEKTLSLGAFTELDEQETAEIDGGVVGLIIAGVGIAALTGVIAYSAKTVGNMNQISQALGNLEQGQTTNVSCKDILGREYDVEVKGGTSFNSYYGDASRLLR